MYDFNKTVEACLLLLANKFKNEDVILDLHRTKYWEQLRLLRSQRQEAIDLGRDMLSSDIAYARFFGISLLGQICNPVEAGEVEEAEKIISWLSDMVFTEHAVCCLIGIANALGNPHLVSAQDALLKLSYSGNNEVRWSASVSLGSVTAGNNSKELTKRLIELSQDKDAQIRDWATMNLGCVEEDSERVNTALLERTKDRHFDTRSEAIKALADRKDRRGIPALNKRLLSNRIGKLDIESAGCYGMSEFLPLLEA